MKYNPLKDPIFMFVLIFGIVLVGIMVYFATEVKRNQTKHYTEICEANQMTYLSLAERKVWNGKFHSTIYQPVCMDDKGQLFAVE